MGASVSTNTQKIENNMYNTSYQKCGSTGAVNTAIVKGVTFEPPADCDPPSSFDINQASKVDAKCLLSSLQNAAAAVSSNMNAKAKAGLGFAVSTNVSDTKNNISNYTSQQCANASTTQTADVEDTIIKSCYFKIAQDATVNQQCQINATQATIAKIASKQAASSKGGSLFGDLFGGVGGIITIVIVIAVIAAVAGILFALLKKGGKGKSKKNKSKMMTEDPDFGGDDDIELKEFTGGFWNFQENINNPTSFMDKLRKNKSMILLIILILVIIFISVVGLSKTKVENKQLTEEDAQKFNDTLKEAHKIAGFDPRSTESPIINNIVSEPFRDNIASETAWDSSSQNNDNTFWDHSTNDVNEPILDDFYKPLL